MAQNLSNLSHGTASKPKSNNFGARVKKDLIRNKYIYLMAIPMLLYYLIFHYRPMYGAIIAFKDFNPMKGILGSPWVGFTHFISFFEGAYFGRVLRNTLLINIYGLLFGFPAPIILALCLNEIQNKIFKRTVQTISYLPHFVSLMVICGIIVNFTSRNGLINHIIAFFGGERVNLLSRPEYFRPIYIISDIWQSVGWGSIIYLAALSGIDVEQYEAARIDGASRWQKIWHISIPGIMPTIVILLILRMGNMMNVGFEKIILLYNPGTYETADVISSYVYRKGLMEFSFSFSSAVGLFNSVINFTLLLCANWISRRVNETSLW